jgi:parallel beta-helix repeat protein
MTPAATSAPIGDEDPLGTHGIHVRNSSDVVVTDNLCHHNNNSGIAVVNSSHVLVQANACYENMNGIGLFNREGLKDPGRHVIGVNMLYDNDQADLKGTL